MSTIPADHPYAPRARPDPVVVQPGAFIFAAAHLDHGHIYGQCRGLLAAGGVLKWVYEPDPVKLAAFRQQHPGVTIARSLDEILADPAVHLVAAAAVPSERGPLGCQVLDAGKDYFTAKTPFTELAQLEAARAAVARTGRRYWVYFSERLHSESAVHATTLVQAGVLGRALQVIGLGPHRLGTGRPDWFFQKARYGGILCDIGSHQFEQFLTFAGATAATITHAAVANYCHPATPELEDFGEAHLVADNGATHYLRVDWLTPAGLSTWGDGRTFILGSKGTLELRKYVDVARERTGDHLYLVDATGEHHLPVAGRVGCPFFGELILDSLHRTETAMTQRHIFAAAELCLRAQAQARRLTP